MSAPEHHLHREVLPRRFAYMASAHRWAGFGLNYMYMNPKAKLFTHLGGRTCQKPGHSCLRKVVSWCSHPAVDYYRWLARGVQTWAPLLLRQYCYTGASCKSVFLGMPGGIE